MDPRIKELKKLIPKVSFLFFRCKNEKHIFASEEPYENAYKIITELLTENNIYKFYYDYKDYDFTDDPNNKVFKPLFKGCKLTLSNKDGYFNATLITKKVHIDFEYFYNTRIASIILSVLEAIERINDFKDFKYISMDFIENLSSGGDDDYAPTGLYYVAPKIDNFICQKKNTDISRYIFQNFLDFFLDCRRYNRGDKRCKFEIIDAHSFSKKYSYAIELKHPITNKVLYIDFKCFSTQKDNYEYHSYYTYNLEKYRKYEDDYDVFEQFAKNKIKFNLIDVLDWYYSLTDDIYIDLNCPYSEKEDVKALGGRWNPIKKKWYILNTKNNIDKCSRWIPDDNKEIYKCLCGISMFSSCIERHQHSYKHLLYEITQMIISS